MYSMESKRHGGRAMIPDVAERTSELARFCVYYAVSRLDLFGDAAIADCRTGECGLSFLVEFQPLPPGGYYVDAYFGLLESLESLFGLPVELVSDSAIRNPYFRQSVEETRTPVYAA